MGAAGSAYLNADLVLDELDVLRVVSEAAVRTGGASR